MKMLNLVVIVIITAVVLFTTVYISQSATQKKQETTGKGFAVLELFTSEGCSSCPPADALLARIEKEAGDKPVYVLAYHVDYWDRLGWTDIFSKAQFSERQKEYSNWLSSDVYTPQLVVNGSREYVGSNEAAIQAAITNALKDSTAFQLELNAKLVQDKVSFDYKVKGKAAGNQVLVALVQKHAVNKVSRGENGGRTLSHVQVVRGLAKMDLEKGGQGTGALELPFDFNGQEWQLIGFIQNTATGEIEAATAVAIAR